MSEATSFIRMFCQHLAAAEQETLAGLGEEQSNRLLGIANDCMDINGAILDAYPREELRNLVYFAFAGVFKEVSWFQLFFLSGHYALLNARLRFVWESIYRASWAETNADAALSLDDKAAWLAGEEKGLRWDNCIEPTLRRLFPLADREQDVRDFYRDLWRTLHEYVHPSLAVTEKLIGPAGLLMCNAFDRDWALETLAAATNVFDLAWLAVLQTFPKAADRLEGRAFSVAYPILKSAFDAAADG